MMTEISEKDVLLEKLAHIQSKLKELEDEETVFHRQLQKQNEEKIKSFSHKKICLGQQLNEISGKLFMIEQSEDQNE